MSDRRLLTTTVIMMGLAALLCVPILAGAQPGEVTEAFAPDSPIVGPGEAVTAEELFAAARESGLWFVVVGLCVYFLVNALLGKATVGGWRVHFGKFSEWLNGKGAKWKFWIIVGLSGIAGAFLGLGGVEGEWVWKSVLIAVGKGLFDGIAVGMAAVAVNSKRRDDKNGKKPAPGDGTV